MATPGISIKLTFEWRNKMVQHCHKYRNVLAVCWMGKLVARKKRLDAVLFLDQYTMERKNCEQ
jgi:hypothetical protein